MEVAGKSLLFFLLLYFSYYFILRFVQSVFQGLVGSINQNLAKFLYVLSTPAHELAHFWVALLCFAKIEQVQLLPKLNRPGFVKARTSSSLPFLISIKEFLIAIAPVIVNVPLFIFIVSKFVIKSDISRILDPRIMSTKEGWITVLLFLLLISGIAPSNEDFKGMLKGLIILSIMIFGVSYLAAVIFKVKSININPILSVLFYYLEVIIAVFIINCVINYKNCLRITYLIIINSLRNTIK